MEANHRWSIRSRKQLIQTGTTWGTPRDVLKKVMEEFSPPDPNGTYTFEVGDLLATSHASELEMTVSAMGEDVKEDKLTPSGHLHAPPMDKALEEVMKEVSKQILRRATEKIMEDLVRTFPLGGHSISVRGLPTQRDLAKGGLLDPDREREQRAVLQDCAPRQHSIIERYDQLRCATKYVCQRCGRGYLLSDQALAHMRYPLTPDQIQDLLG